MSEHLLLMDASGFAFRAYYSNHPRYRDDGAGATGAVEVFLGMVWRLLGRAQADAPTMGVAVFDAPGANFRHELFPHYKANRPVSRHLELGPQLQIMRPASKLLSLHPVEAPGFEADDVIATLATRARAQGIRVTIVSSDKDFAQLVEDGWIEIVDPMQRKRVLAADVEARWGVAPSLVPDIQALTGDGVDNIPGLDGCGPDTAGKLVRRFGDLEQVLANVSSIRFPKVRTQLQRMLDVRLDEKGRAFLSGALKGNGQSGADWCRLFYRLAYLRRDVPMEVNFEAYRRTPIFRDDLLTFLQKLGAGARAEAIFGMDPQLQRLVAPIPPVLLPQKGPRGGKLPPKEVDATMDWWRQELAAPGQRLTDVPQCGYYQRATMKGAPLVPARIWREPEYDWETDTPTGMEILRCEVGGRPRDPLAEWPSLSMKPISEEEYRTRMRKIQPGKPPPPTSVDQVKSIPNPRLKGKS